MEFVKVEKHESGKDVIVAKQKIFFLKDRERKFLCGKEYPTGYWTWLELPGLKSVSDIDSFLFNKWYQLHLDTKKD